MLLKITSRRSSLAFVQPITSYDDIMDALETQYDNITETEALLNELFLITQGEQESVVEFGGQLHSVAYKIKQSQGDKGGRDDDEFVQQNFFPRPEEQCHKGSIKTSAR